MINTWAAAPALSPRGFYCGRGRRVVYSARKPQPGKAEGSAGKARGRTAGIRRDKGEDGVKTEKRGGSWTAYYDADTGRHFARIMHISREGLEQYDYEITQEIYARLGGFGDDAENERLIRTAKPVYSFENTMYGTLGPERTVWDGEAHEAMLGHERKKRKGK